MGKRSILDIMCLALAAAALVGGVNAGRAHAEEIKQSTPNMVSIHNPENVPKLRSTTNAQREEAARLAAEYRAEAARAAALKNTTTPGTIAPNKAVPPKATGGTNE